MRSRSEVHELIKIEGSTFRMGSTRREIDDAVSYWGTRLVDPTYTRAQFRSWLEKEYPAHEITVESFGIARYPVTNAQYFQFVRTTGESLPDSIALDEPDEHPVWGVTYAAATRYCTWMSYTSAIGYRLPSEAEWEYAASGPSDNEYPYGTTFCAECGNTVESGIGHTTPVDQFADFPSEHGLVDLAGNVEEWTSGVYRPYPGGSSIDDDLARVAGDREYRVLRGGSFARGGDLTRCARRHGPHPGREHRYRGFRVAASI